MIIPAERFRGGIWFAVVCMSEAFPSVCPDAYLGNGFSDFIVILQEYELAYEDGSLQVWLHCTNWK